MRFPLEHLTKHSVSTEQSQKGCWRVVSFQYQLGFIFQTFSDLCELIAKLLHLFLKNFMAVITQNFSSLHLFVRCSYQFMCRLIHLSSDFMTVWLWWATMLQTIHGLLEVASIGNTQNPETFAFSHCHSLMSFVAHVDLFLVSHGEKKSSLIQTNVDFNFIFDIELFLPSLTDQPKIIYEVMYEKKFNLKTPPLFRCIKK